ncbi:hypothetical protein ACWDKQ_01980 [Saccharopolyspora sp. NPDC000995]
MLVVVDVLSFSTAVDVATTTGARVLPLRWQDASIPAGAVLAQPRSLDESFLSPSSLRTRTCCWDCRHRMARRSALRRQPPGPPCS